MGQSMSLRIRGGKKCIGKYELGDVIGHGAYGKVYRARNMEKRGEIVAVKALNKENVCGTVRRKIEKEVSVMMSLSHPNIVQTYDVIDTEAKVYIVMEYVSGGDLLKIIQREGQLSQDVARKFFHQLISAVEYCHVRGIIHRDLKPENLLVDVAGNLKVADFGLCATWEHRQQYGLLHTRCGSQGYTAPELLNTRLGYVGASADVYSCGVILYNMLTGSFPVEPSNEPEYLASISRADFECPEWFTGKQRWLIRQLLEPDPGRRITIPRIMVDPWFREGLEASEEMAAAAAAATAHRSEASTSKGSRSLKERRKVDSV